MEILIAVLGLVLGSFSGVLYEREGLGLRSTLGRSRCSKCQHKLSSIELIPIVSYFFLRGKCRWCKSTISTSTILVEIFTSLLFLLIYQRYGATPSVLAFYFMAVFAYPLIYVDLKTLRIPNAWVLLSFAALIYQVSFEVIRNGISSSIHRGAVAFTLVSLFYLSLHIFTGGKGMGMGDVKLAPILVTSASLINFNRGFTAFISGILISGIVAIVLLVSKRVTAKTRIAFGPFLIAGYWLAVLLPEVEIAKFIGLWIL